MAASVFDHVPLAGLFDAGETARLFTASADIRALLLVEGGLAKVQGAAGVIPETSAAAIHRATLEIALDPGALTTATAQNGVCVPALVSAFRAAMQAPEHAQYLHWGATSQDIIDTGLMLRLRQAVGLILADLDTALVTLADLAKAHANTAMAGRTYGQQAAPTSFGAVVASWGWPLLQARSRLAACTFPVSLSGAVGTGSELGPEPEAIRSALADALDLADLGRSWHTDRTPVLDIATALGDAVTALATLGTDVVALAQTEVAEITLSGAGASSTMPQKQNPVAASALIALANTHHGLAGVLHQSAVHAFQRDGAAWFTEWMVLPQIVLGAATAARHAAALAHAITPNPDRMARTLTGDGLVFAERLSFALAQMMPRTEAQAVVKELAAKARTTGKSLQEVAQQSHPDLPKDIFVAKSALGAAPSEVLRFAQAVKAL